MNLESAYIDELTGIYNRRYLREKQKEAAEIFIIKKLPFSVIWVDIDHFKDVNDTYGHLRGDKVLKEFAQFLKSSSRELDTVLRYGGDEFVSVMPNVKRQDAEQIYDQILTRCKKKKFSGLKLTISVGIASYPTDGARFEELLKVADESLYEAKRSGRDRIGTVVRKRIEIPSKRYVDRNEEKKVLEKFLKEGNGRARSAIVRGNVGIGKTRFVKEVLKNVNGKEILWSDCLALFEEMSYYAIREMIKYKLKRQRQEILEKIPLAYRIELGKLVPDVMLDIKENIVDSMLIMDKYRLYESVKRVVDIGQDEKIIVIDNMQWADNGTIEVIKYLLKSSRGKPFTFIFTYRQEEKTKALDDFADYINREAEVIDIVLNPFEYEEIREMISSVIGEEPESELIGYIEQESGGNPFYIEEILKALTEVSHLRPVGDAWLFERPSVELIPKSIEDITERKCQQLSTEGEEILEIASVIGKFDINIIKEITDYNEGHIIGILEDIKRLGLISERGEFMEFHEEISRNAIYKKRASGIKGRMLHKKVAERLTEQYKGREKEVIEELAFHYYQAMDKENGVKYSIEAGDRAKEQYANSSAINYYTWAENLLRDEKKEEQIRKRIDSLVKRANVLRFTGDNEGAMRDLDRGLEDAVEINDKKQEVNVRYMKTTVYSMLSQSKKAIAEAENCIEIYKEIGDKKGIANSLNVIGKSYFHFGELDRALKFFEDALDISREMKDKYFEAKILSNMGFIYIGMGKFGKALKIYEDALAFMKKVEDKYGIAMILNNVGIIYKRMGDYEKAIKNYEGSLKIARDIGSRYTELNLLNNIGGVYSGLGDYTNAIKYYEDSLKISKDVRNTYNEALVLNNLGHIYMTFAEYTRALQYLEDSLRIKKDIEDKDGESSALHIIGRIYVDLGDYSKALEYLESSLKIAEKIRASERIFNSSLSLAYLYLMLSETKKSKKYIDQAHTIAKDTNSKVMLRDVLYLLCNFYLEKNNLKEFKKNLKALQDLSDEIKARDFEGNLNLLLGRYNTETKNFKKAEEHFYDALEMFKNLQEKLNIGRVYYYFGMLELARGKESASKKYFKKSLKISRSIGAKGWEKKLENLEKVEKS